MAAFAKPEDIANRAIQICRGKRFNAFTDFTPAATETGFVYEKLREAELRRRVWRFAVRRAVLRVTDTSTVIWTPPAYASGTTYPLGAVVTSGGEWWQSKVASNVGNTPASGASWQRYFGPDSMEPFVASAISFHAGELTLSGGVVYLSLIDSNTDTPPTANWLAVNGTTAALQILYPISTGPRSDQSTMNVCRLPHGYLRRAPTDPKSGQYHVVGVGLAPVTEDWIFEGNFIVTRDINPVLLRFVANMVDVPDMDPMFCEALSAKIALEVAPVVAEAEYVTAAIRDARTRYKQLISDAGIVNGIEQGSTSPPVDDWIMVRL